MKKQCLVASNNPGKIKEIKAILGDMQLELLSPREIGLSLKVDETGTTYAENAILKAKAFAEAAKMAVLADDSGLEVQALDRAPGIFSARFAPQANATDADRRKYLIQQLEGKPQPWHGHFHCTAVLTSPAGPLYQTTGRCDGIIIPEERGKFGFGYDPVFYIPSYQATMAELPAAIKNTISHRANAIRAMRRHLQAFFESN